MKVGETVNWRGGFGCYVAESAIITAIELTPPGEKYGDSVDYIAWDDARMADGIVVSLANGHWAYGWQLARIAPAQ